MPTPDPTPPALESLSASLRAWAAAAEKSIHSGTSDHHLTPSLAILIADALDGLPGTTRSGCTAPVPLTPDTSDDTEGTR